MEDKNTQHTLPIEHFQEFKNIKVDSIEVIQQLSIVDDLCEEDFKLNNDE